MPSFVNKRFVLNCTAVFFIIVFVFIANAAFSSFTLRIFNLCGIYIILALSLNLVNGFTGLFSLGHAGFIKAPHLDKVNLPGLHFVFNIGVVVFSAIIVLCQL